MGDASEANRVVKVETGRKTVEVMLQAPAAELRLRVAWLGGCGRMEWSYRRTTMECILRCP